MAWPDKTVQARVVSAPTPNNSRTLKVKLAWINGDNTEKTYTLKVWIDAAFVDKLTEGATGSALIRDYGQTERVKDSDPFVDAWNGEPAKPDKKKGSYAPRHELEAALAHMAGQIGAAAIANGKTSADAVTMFNALTPHVKTAARSIRS